MMMVKVLVEFADRDDFLKRYRVGDEVSFADAEYVKMLVARGIVEDCNMELSFVNDSNFVSSPDIDLSKSWNCIVKSLKSFNNLDRLKQYLEIENSGKPRATVVKAIGDRIEELSYSIGL